MTTVISLISVKESDCEHAAVNFCDRLSTSDYGLTESEGTASEVAQEAFYPY
jgi:hypothetical protein